MTNSRTSIIKGLLLLAFLLMTGAGLFAQKPESPKEVKKHGDFYYKMRNYRAAVPLYLQYQLAVPQDFNLKYSIGICYYYMDSIDRAVAYFKYSMQDPAIPDEVYWYMAKCSSARDNHDLAAQYYKAYLGTLDAKSPLRPHIIASIKQCVNARKMALTASDEIVENLGSRINTHFDELYPVTRKGDEAALYFTSKREGNFGDAGCSDTDGPGYEGDCFRSDLYRTALERGDWATPTAGAIGFNSEQDDILYGFSKDGKKAWYYRGTDNKRGDLCFGEFQFDGGPTEPHLLPEPFNTLGVWEGNLYSFSDSLVIFSSERPGGYGSKDLWFCVMFADSSWSSPRNMGPEVNSPLDEDFPFLTRDGRTLYFSSNQRESGGGYDIFTTKFDPNIRTWTKPANLGFPVNSTGDDICFRLMDDGYGAYLSSNRSGGVGCYDLYSVYFRQPKQEQLHTSVPPTFVPLLKNPPRQVLDSLGTEPVVETPIEPVKQALPAPKPFTPKTITATFLFDQIYYTKANGAINPASFKTINSIAKFALDYPETVIILTAHCDSAGIPLKNIYLTLKQAETVAKLLTDQGVSPERIIFQGVGYGFPLTVAKGPDNKVNPIAASINQRIDVTVANLDNYPVETGHVNPDLPPQGRDPRGSNYQKASDGLVYRVQLASIQRPFEDPILIRYKGAMAEAQFGLSTVRYCTGLCSTFAEAKKILDAAIKDGFTEAFVVPYYRNIRIDTYRAAELSGQFPDLVDYLNTKN